MNNDDLARDFIKGMFESNGVEDWQAKLRARPDVREWAVKQFDEALAHINKEKQDDNKDK